MAQSKKKGFEMPHIFVILTFIMLIVWIISFIIPSGNFEMVTDPNSGRQIVNPDVFSFADKTYITPFKFFQAFYQGLVNGIGIMGNLLICSGVLGFLESTGAFSAGSSSVSFLPDLLPAPAVPMSISRFRIPASGSAAYRQYSYNMRRPSMPSKSTVFTLPSFSLTVTGP